MEQHPNPSERDVLPVNMEADKEQVELESDVNISESHKEIATDCDVEFISFLQNNVKNIPFQHKTYEHPNSLKKQKIEGGARSAENIFPPL